MMPLRSALERPHGRPEFPLAGGSPSCLKTGHVQSGRPRCGNWRAPGRIFLILRTSVRPAPRIGREHGYRRRFTISPVNPATSAALCGTPCSCSIPTRSFIPSRDRGGWQGACFLGFARLALFRRRQFQPLYRVPNKKLILYGRAENTR